MLKEILNKFLIISGVQAAIVVQENGEIIESMKSGILMDEQMKTAISTLMVDAKTTVTMFGKEPIEMVFVEFSDYSLVIGPLAEEFFLLVIAKNTANTGQITYEMKKNQQAIVSCL